MIDEDKNFGGPLVLDLRKWWRHVGAKNIWVGRDMRVTVSWPRTQHNAPCYDSASLDPLIRERAH